MSHASPGSEVLAVKDESAERPIPTAWRQTFRDIVEAFIASDYRLEKAVPGVAPIPVDTAEQIRDYLDGYGATLVTLPEETWSSSVCIWFGEYWDTLVDLWTVEEGRSDLVLHAKVTDSDGGFTIQVHLVYVP